MDNVLRQIRRLYFQKRGLSSDLLNTIADCDIREQAQFISSLSYGGRWLLGSLFPREWNFIVRPSGNPYTENATNAIRWTIAKCIAHRTRLLAAINSQASVEHATLIGSGPESRSRLSAHVQAHGESLWSLSLHFLQQEQFSGVHGNRSALNSILRSCNNDWMRFVSYIFSQRAQSNLTHREYLECLNVFLMNLTTPSISDYAAHSLRYRFFSELKGDDAFTADVLHFESRHALLDQLRTLLQLLAQRAVHTLAPGEIDAVLQLAAALPTPSAVNVASVASRGVVLPTCNSHAAHDCLEAYLRGRYREAATMSVTNLLTDSTVFTYFTVAAQSAVHASLDCPLLFPKTSPAQRLLDSLYDWYSARRDRRDSIESLQSLARALSETLLGPPLRAFIGSIDGDTPEPAGRSTNVVGSPACFPQFAYAFADRRHGIEFVDRYSVAYGDSFATHVARSLVTRCISPKHVHTTPLGLSEFEQIRHDISVLLYHKDYSAASQLLGNRRTSKSASTISDPDLHAAEILSLLELGEIEKAAHVLAELFCDDPKSVPPASLRLFSRLLSNGSLVPDKSNIAWPILAVASIRDDGRPLDTDRIHDFVGDFIESRGFTRPTELLRDCDPTSKQELEFLVSCCIKNFFVNGFRFAPYLVIARQAAHPTSLKK